MTELNLQTVKALIDGLTIEVLTQRAIIMLWRADHDVDLESVMRTLATTLPKAQFERLRPALENSARAIIDWSDDLAAPEEGDPIN